MRCGAKATLAGDCTSSSKKRARHRKKGARWPSSHTWAKRKGKSGLNFVRHSPDDRDGGLAEVLADRFLLPILCWTTGSLLFELIGLSLCFIEFCSFL
jgi:hypothetical protein